MSNKQIVDTAEIQPLLDRIHNNLGIIDAAAVSPYINDARRVQMIRDAVAEANAALREVERHE